MASPGGSGRFGAGDLHEGRAGQSRQLAGRSTPHCITTVAVVWRPNCLCGWGSVGVRGKRLVIEALQSRRLQRVAVEVDYKRVARLNLALRKRSERRAGSSRHAPAGPTTGVRPQSAPKSKPAIQIDESAGNRGKMAPSMAPQQKPSQTHTADTSNVIRNAALGLDPGQLPWPPE